MTIDRDARARFVEARGLAWALVTVVRTVGFDGGAAARDDRREVVDVADESFGNVGGSACDDGEDVGDEVFVAHDVDVIALGGALKSADGDGERSVRIFARRRGCVRGVQRRVSRPLSTHCLLYTSPSPRDKRQSRMPSSA